VVSPDAFRASLDAPAPPAGIGVPLQALWWAGKNDWDKAHALVMNDDSREAAWVHAYLHRVEGDLANAGYWYRRAERPHSEAALDEEWAAIMSALLARD
jgi:hypothetical protein